MKAPVCPGGTRYTHPACRVHALPFHAEKDGLRCGLPVPRLPMIQRQSPPRQNVPANGHKAQKSAISGLRRQSRARPRTQATPGMAHTIDTGWKRTISHLETPTDLGPGHGSPRSPGPRRRPSDPRERHARTRRCFSPRNRVLSRRRRRPKKKTRQEMGVGVKESPLVTELREKSRPGVVAQLGERIHGMDEVRGSIPLDST